MTHHNTHDLEIIKTLATILSEAAYKNDTSVILRAGPVIADITTYVEGVAEEINNPSPVHCARHDLMPPLLRRFMPKRNTAANPQRVVLLAYRDGKEIEETYCGIPCLLGRFVDRDYEIVPRESMLDRADRWIPTEQDRL